MAGKYGKKGSVAHQKAIATRVDQTYHSKERQQNVQNYRNSDDIKLEAAVRRYRKALPKTGGAW